MTENKKLKCAIHCLKVNADIEVCEECEAYTSGDLACRDIAREAIKALEELQMYRDGKLCLVPKDVLKRQCDELDAYKELGTVEEVGEAVEKTVVMNPEITTVSTGTIYMKCPKCKLTTVIYREMIVGYCPKCGQRLESEE